MNVLQFLTPKSQTNYLNTECTVRQAVEKMDFHKFSILPLIDNSGRYVSSISEGDLLRHVKNEHNFNMRDAERIKVIDVAKHRPYKACLMTAELQEILQLLLDQNFLPIVDDRGMFCGIVKRKSVLEYIFNHKDEIAFLNK